MVAGGSVWFVERPTRQSSWTCSQPSSKSTAKMHLPCPAQLITHSRAGPVNELYDKVSVSGHLMSLMLCRTLFRGGAMIFHPASYETNVSRKPANEVCVKVSGLRSALFI
jgi:hypothetical protein